MPSKKMKKATETLTSVQEDHSPGVKEFMYYIPQGVCFDDIYICTSEVARQLQIHKRTVTNMRTQGKLTYIKMWGKIYYYKQEIAAMMEAARVNKSKKMIWVALSSFIQFISCCFLDDSLLPSC